MTDTRKDDPSNEETVILRPGKKADPFGAEPTAKRSDDTLPRQEPKSAAFVDPFKTVLMGSAAQRTVPYAASEETDLCDTRIIRPDHGSSATAPHAHSSSGINPIVGLLVVVGGPGKGAFRPLYYGNNSIGRSSKERVSLDFGDDTISHTEQAYIRYDPEDRQFLFIPNLAKSNIVAVNDTKPTAAIHLHDADIIKIGQTHLRFIPVCGVSFDWGDVVNQ